MTEDDVHKRVMRVFTGFGEGAYRYEARCTRIWLEHSKRPRVRGALVEYFSEGSETAIDGSEVVFVDDKSGEFVAQPGH